MTHWEYRVVWFNPAHKRGFVEHPRSERELRARASDLRRRGMRRVRMERRQWAPWESLR